MMGTQKESDTSPTVKIWASHINPIEFIDSESLNPILADSSTRTCFGTNAMVKSLLYNGHRLSTMRNDCNNIVQNCIQCQRFNIGKHGFHPMSYIHAELPLDHVAFDLKEFIVFPFCNKQIRIRSFDLNRQPYNCNLRDHPSRQCPIHPSPTPAPSPDPAPNLRK